MDEKTSLSRADTLCFFNGDELATDVFLKKYALTNPDGVIEEYLPSQMWARLAKGAASIEEDKDKWGKSFYSILEDWKAIPQGSVLFALGNPYQKSSFSNCFVIPIQNDDLESIFECAKEMSKTYAYRGGVGIDISVLRPEGAKVTNAARTSTGAWSFMDFYSYVTRLIGQHGRRGALMITMSDTHPDLLNFITAKTDKTKITGANISVKLSDAFMDAVAKEKDWTLSFTTKHETFTRTMPATIIWDLIVETATNTAEPGILFWDTILRESPADCYADEGFRTMCCNPCVTKDTWIMTDKGPLQVKDLIGHPFNTIVDGRSWESSFEGFFYTGKKKILEIITDRGYHVKCTRNHKIKAVISNERGNKKISWISASDLKVGDRISLNNVGTLNEWDSNLPEFDYGFNDGWLVGYLQGDGTYEHFKNGRSTAKLNFWDEEGKQIRSYAEEKICASSIVRRSDCGYSETNKLITCIKSVGLMRIAKQCGINNSKLIDEIIEYTSSDFYRGFLQGWFDADGCVNYSCDKQSYSIRLSSIYLSNLLIAQKMLSRLGIMSSIYTERRDEGWRMLPDGKGGQKEYWCESNNDLCIGRDNISKFVERVGFGCENKKKKTEKLLSEYTRGPYKESFTAKIVSIQKCRDEDVYDCTIEKVHEFDANGISVHNCAEIPLSNFDACTLLAMNLTKYTRNDFQKDSSFDFDAFDKDVKVAVRFLDNVKEMDLKLMPLKQQRQIAAKGRRIGMGTTGLGDTLANLGIKYDSDKAIEFVDQLFEFYAKSVYKSSVALGKEKGAFPIFNADKEKDNPFLKRIGFAGVPRRNIACLTCAPTGSVSCLCQTSSGVEPIFRNFYTRRRKITHNESVNVPKNKLSTDKLGDLWQEYDVAHHNVQRYLKIKDIDLNSTSVNEIALPKFFVESNNIDWKNRVKIQSTMQKWIDHSISSTCNVPSGTSKEVVKSIYMEAYKQGNKGFTVYVDGCRDGVLNTRKDCKDCIQKTDAPKRPKSLDADMHHITVKGQLYFCMISLMYGDPYEVFAGQNGIIDKKVKKAQITKKQRGHYEALLDDGVLIENIGTYITDEQAAVTRLISLSLRHGADIKHCVDVLEKVPGDLHNFAHCISRVLKKYIAENSIVTGFSCPDCGSGNIVRADGCKKCADCSWTACQ